MKKLLQHVNDWSPLLVALTTCSSKEAASEMWHKWSFINPAGAHVDLDVITFAYIPGNISYASRWDHAASFLCGNIMYRMKGNKSILCGKTTFLHKVIHWGITITGSKSPPVFAACQHFLSRRSWCTAISQLNIALQRTVWQRLNQWCLRNA